ncbi:flagellar basal body P-ring formation chaperone FlgA [Brevundimonas sp.]|uniref:flagellar basal body P-ring formation chaperone FlgA n=1 Tax=Brevundimonas sp. TaxID=1871086 RepID=UPI0039C8874A
MIRALIAAVVLMAGSPAFASDVTLKANPVDDDGQVTLGEVFDGAGAAASVVVARRSGPTVVIEAGTLQASARRAGLIWANPQGLRRVVVREGAPASAGPGGSATSARRSGPTVEALTYARSIAAGEVIQPEDVIWAPMQSHLVPAGAPQDADAVIGMSARRALRSGAAVQPNDLTAPKVISRNEMVTVTYSAPGVTLTVTGRAQRDAARGQPVAITNLQSGRTIDAVAVAPGRAVTGPAAQAARSNPQAFQ